MNPNLPYVSVEVVSNFDGVGQKRIVYGNLNKSVDRRHVRLVNLSVCVRETLDVVSDEGCGKEVPISVSSWDSMSEVNVLVHVPISNIGSSEVHAEYDARSTSFVEDLTWNG